MQRTLTIDYSDEVLLALGCSPEQFNEEAKLLVAVKFYELGRLSSGAAAKLASIPKPLFLTKLADYGVDAFQLKRRRYFMDKDYVKGVIEGLGGAKVLMDEMDEYHQIVAHMRKERPSLVERYPDKWVAMGQKGVLAIGDSMDEVLRELESRGLNGADVVIEFLDTDPPLLIL